MIKDIAPNNPFDHLYSQKLQSPTHRKQRIHQRSYIGRHGKTFSRGGILQGRKQIEQIEKLIE